VILALAVLALAAVVAVIVVVGIIIGGARSFGRIHREAGW
jgi:hypothetical protein